nr:hypothetical protein [Tanacetum cinerariifolium]
MAEALRDADWVSAMQEELDQFAKLNVWRLVPRPEVKTIIKTKWIFKNKKDESSLVIQNKARLVAVGFVSKQHPDHVYALDKDLYGLKQAPQTWLKNTQKGQNRIKTGQKREAWRSREKSEAVTVD